MRRPTRNSRQVATIAATLGPFGGRSARLPNGRERSRRRRSTRTAEPRVERRSNRKSRSRSPSPVPTRVSTIKYLAFKSGRRLGKFYLLFTCPPNRVNRLSNLTVHVPNLLFLFNALLRPPRKPSALPNLTPSRFKSARKIFSRKFIRPPFRKVNGAYNK